MNYYNYFTEVEEHFLRRRGKHMHVSPLDWALIATWRDSGIPLHVALRGIDIAMDTFFARPRGRRYVGTLFYCHDPVMEEYARHLESRIGETPAGTGEQAGDTGAAPPAGEEHALNRAEIFEFLGSKISEINSLRAKHNGKEEALLRQGLERAAGRLEEIARDFQKEPAPDFEALEKDLALVDGTLVSELSTFISEEDMNAWQEQAKKELKIYRKRLPKETYRKIQDNYLRKRIRQHFGVGELSLFHL
jgi:hypothetical protein